MGTSTKTDRVLVLGLGNRVMTDDAAGLAALESFRERYGVPDGVDCMDGGTLGLDLLAYLEGYDNVLIADCVMRRGERAGSVLCVEAKDVEAVFQTCLSPHQMGLKDVIAVLHLQGRVPERLTVVGVEGKEIGLGTELTSEVGASITEMADRMAEVLRSWGYPVERI